MTEVCSDVKRNPRWNKKSLYKIAKKYKGKKDFHRNCNGGYRAAKRLGILDNIFNFKLQKNGRKVIWTRKAIKNEAKKYKHRNEFNKNSSSAYKIASKLGILNDVCKHMIKKPRKIKWTKLNIKDEAIKYHTRMEFKTNARGAYQLACDLKVLDEICNHMPKNAKIKN